MSECYHEILGASEAATREKELAELEAKKEEYEASKKAYEAAKRKTYEARMKLLEFMKREAEFMKRVFGNETAAHEVLVDGRQRGAYDRQRAKENEKVRL